MAGGWGGGGGNCISSVYTSYHSFSWSARFRFVLSRIVSCGYVPVHTGSFISYYRLSYIVSAIHLIIITELA